MLKQLIITCILIISCLLSYGQTDSTKNLTYRTRYLLFTTPVKKNTIINGVAVGIMAVPWMKAESLKINGINIELEPMVVFVFPSVVFGSFFAPFRRDSLKQNESPLDNYNLFPERAVFYGTSINGINLSGGGVSDSKINGISVNGLTAFAEEVNGIEITGVMNLHYSFNGVIIAGFRNKTTTGNGPQIGLFNTCKSGQLVQIGLFNRIGNRVIPLINFSLKKKPTLPVITEKKAT